eukprot:604725-Amphidinium_carterae.1
MSKTVYANEFSSLRCEDVLGTTMSAKINTCTGKLVRTYEEAGRTNAEHFLLQHKLLVRFTLQLILGTFNGLHGLLCDQSHQMDSCWFALALVVLTTH